MDRIENYYIISIQTFSSGLKALVSSFIFCLPIVHLLPAHFQVLSLRALHILFHLHVTFSERSFPVQLRISITIIASFYFILQNFLPLSLPPPLYQFGSYMQPDFFLFFLNVGLFLVSFSVPLVYMSSLTVPILFCLYYISLQHILDLGSVCPPTLSFLFFQNCFGYFRSVTFSYKLQNKLVSFYKKPVGIIDFSLIFSLLILYHDISLHLFGSFQFFLQFLQVVCVFCLIYP